MMLCLKQTRGLASEVHEFLWRELHVKERWNDSIVNLAYDVNMRFQLGEGKSFLAVVQFVWDTVKSKANQDRRA